MSPVTVDRCLGPHFGDSVLLFPQVCAEKIEQDELRVAKMVRSKHFDGFQENWHHVRCFLRTAAPFRESDVDGLDSLRWEDQEKLKKKIGSCAFLR